MQIYLDGWLVQKVRSASRTKALLHGVELAAPLSLALHSTNTREEVCPGQQLTYSPASALPGDRQPSRPALPH